MSAAEMAAEGAARGEATASSATSNGYASDARDHELSNGTSAGAVPPEEGGDRTETAGALPRRARSEIERKLIARGRVLLHMYQQKKREKQEMLGEMCFSETSEMSAVDVLDSRALPSDHTSTVFSDKHKSLHFDDANEHCDDHDDHARSNGSSSSSSISRSAFTAAAASVDSDVNWLAPSLPRRKPQANAFGDGHNSADLLDAMEAKLEQLWAALGEKATRDPIVQSARQSISHLIDQKRIAEAGRAASRSDGDATLAASSEPSAQVAEGSQPTAEALQAELVEAKSLISELNGKVNAYRAQLLTCSSKSVDAHANGRNGYVLNSTGVDAEVKKLRVRVQEKEELLLSLRSSLEHVIQDHGKLDKELSWARATIERLEGEKEQMQKAASDKRTLLHRAYIVKAKQLDHLCKDVELPSTWERITDENGIIYYRQNDRACAPELEDPRVTLALQRSPFARSGSASPRSASGRMEHAAHAARTSDRKYSSSSFDSTVSCEDITIPPEDGTKHEVEDFETPLPDGWEMRVTTGGSVFFVNRNTNVTTWKDPRRMKRGKSVMVKRSSAPLGSLAAPSLTVDIPERRASIGAPPMSAPEDSSLVRNFDVVFHDKGPIGIHFQANTPDTGATVRRLLPRMAASRSQQIEPFDRLIAVNKNSVNNAPFRYVMLLLQGGLRPLTLTFERDSTSQRRVEPTYRAVDAGEHLDEEVVLDDTDHREPGVNGVTTQNDTGADSLPRRSRHSSSSSDSSASEVESTPSAPRDDDFSIADKIITNVFSLFWTPPEQPRGRVETV